MYISLIRKLDEAERDRRLREMQDNAKWREEQRERNFKRYKDDDDREEKANKDRTSDFIKYVFSINYNFRANIELLSCYAILYDMV